MLRTIQIERIKKMLSFPDNYFKILILDDTTKALISPLLKLNDLRSLGITTYFNINTKRQKITDIPVIYFIEPKSSNLDLIIEDIENDLYHSYYLNFTTQLKRSELERLGYSASKVKRGYYVQSVYDQFIDFIALQNNLFTIPRMDSLFSVFYSYKCAPFIVSRNVDCESMRKKFGLLERKAQKPLLIVLDRKFDMTTPIEHVWTYNSLINDLLTFNDNKVTFEDKIYEIDPCDPFWQENQGEFFPVVAERIEKEVTEQKKQLAMRNIDDRTDKKKIEEILLKTPELALKNERIQTHTAICLKLVEIIKKRRLDDFYRLSKSNGRNNEILEMANYGTDNDIIKLAVAVNENVGCQLLESRNIKCDLIGKIKVANVQSTISQRVGNFLGNIKRLLPVTTECPIFYEVENIYNSIKAGNYENLNIVDVDERNVIYDKEIESIFVVVIGGVVYDEYNSLMRLKEKLNIPIYLGSNRIINSDSFLNHVE